jgi:SnoaL-like polyketide cyclase
MVAASLTPRVAAAQADEKVYRLGYRSPGLSLPVPSIPTESRRHTMANSAPLFPYDRYNKDVWDSHSPDELAKYVASDARVHSMTPGKVAGSGLDYLKARAASLLRAFPDVKFVIEEVVQQGDRLAARSRSKEHTEQISPQSQPPESE